MTYDYFITYDWTKGSHGGRESVEWVSNTTIVTRQDIDQAADEIRIIRRYDSVKITGLVPMIEKR